MGIRRIMAATDFSADAHHAAGRAAQLGSILQSEEVVLVHVVEANLLDRLSRLAGGEKVRQEIRRKAETAAEALAGETERRWRCRVRPQVLCGNLVDGLGEAAAECDLLVIGSRGNHPIKEMAVGTTAQRLLRKTSRPVLVVRRAPERAYGRVLVGIDFSDESHRALEAANVVAPGAAVNLLHAFEAPLEGAMTFAGVTEGSIDSYLAEVHDEAVADMKRFLGTSPVNGRIRWGVHQGYAPVVLREKAQTWDVDLIVVGSRGISRVEKYFLGSVTEHVLAESSADVLVVN